MTALAVAIVGMAGTLVAPLVTQWLVMRARQQELRAGRERRAEERQRDGWRERRDAYVALNAAFRAFRRAMRNHALDATDQTRAELEQARQAFDLRHAEGQLVTSDPVMDAARSASILLSDAYDRLRRLDGATPGSEEARAALLAELDGHVHDEVRDLRMAMRAELGTSGSLARPSW
jgi:hypothetical protein